MQFCNVFKLTKVRLAMIGIMLPFCCGAMLGQNLRHEDSGKAIIRTDLVTLEVDLRAGTIDILWKDGDKLLGVTSAVQLADGRKLSTSTYTTHTLLPVAVGTGALNRDVREYTIRNSRPGTPALLQHIWIYKDKSWLAVQGELDASGSFVGTRHFDAAVVPGNGIQVASAGTALRVLHVPFDNDMWFRWNSIPVTSMKDGQQYTSQEVTTVYDNESRQGLVLGSIAHDIWKTAIDFSAVNGKLESMDIYGGISSPRGERSDTHDFVPHGIVHGSRVTSPKVFIGSFADWRDGLEAYGKANAEEHPPLLWAAGAPMGWNSWAAYADKIDDHRYLGAAEFVRDKLVPQGFGRKIVYINLDAFWSKLDAVQLSDAVANIQRMRGANGVRFEPGIYWTPFAYWSDDLDAYVEGTDMKYRYRDILLKEPNGSLVPKLDGGRPLDPSHPGTKERTAYYLKQFQQLGFKYLKLDFLSHGALEGAHYDPAIQTGIEAYNLGMRQIVEENAGRMFLSLSIAPLFPSGYGNARRLSCDTKGHISGKDQSTEYMLNSLTYGWWTAGNLYIADPDHIVLGDRADQGARSIVEGKSRLLSAILSGGMILDSTRLADDPQGQALALAVYNNRRLFAVASQGKVFRPVEGDSGDTATNVFERRSDNGYYVAVFNYSDSAPTTVQIPLARIAASLGRADSVSITDVATGKRLAPARKTMSVTLLPAQSQLIEITSNKDTSQ